ncbi:hypothetical protein GCM10023259_023970 [Thermocatellispora tengchongensis]
MLPPILPSPTMPICMRAPLILGFAPAAQPHGLPGGWRVKPTGAGRAGSLPPREILAGTHAAQRGFTRDQLDRRIGMIR